MTLLIVGAGGHGRDIAATARALDLRYRIVDDDANLWMPVPEVWDGPWAIGVGEPSVRVAMAARFASPAAVLVDPRAIVGEDCGFAEGAVVGPGCILVSECTVGRHAHITYGVKATRAVFGDFCTVGPGVSFSGYVQVGARAYVGAGSVVKNKVRIGADAVVGCGAVVVEDVPDGVTVVGNPARDTKSEMAAKLRDFANKDCDNCGHPAGHHRGGSKPGTICASCGCQQYR